HAEDGIRDFHVTGVQTCALPIYTEQMGKVLSDVQQAYGSFSAPETSGGKTLITGRVPVANFMNYSSEFAAFTHGKGALSLLFDRSEERRVGEECKHRWSRYE